MSIEMLVLYLPVAFLVVIAPGADVLFIITNGVSNGPKAGVLSVCGIATGMLIHTILATVGLGILLKTMPLLYQGLLWSGALYLGYLGLSALRGSGGLAEIGHVEAKNALEIWRDGLFVNLLNPKALLFVVALLPQFIDPASSLSVSMQFFLLGLIIIGMMALVMTPIGICAGRCGEWLKNNPAYGQYVNRIVGVLFIGLAVWVIIGQ